MGKRAVSGIANILQWKTLNSVHQWLDQGKELISATISGPPFMS